MLNFLKPSNIQKLWASEGDISPPPNDTKIAQGFIVEVPTLEDFNYIENRQDAMLAHINQRGIPAWDAGTDYLGYISYVQGANGVIYRALVDNIGVDPVTDTTNLYWKPPFYSTTTTYTKSEVNSAFLSKSNNLADLPDYSVARSNLGVFSSATSSSLFAAKSANLSDLTNPVTAFTNIKQQATETTTGVMAIASIAETEAGSISNKAVSPAKLKLGFNVSLATNGYVVFPYWLGGITLRWGTELLGANSNLLLSPLVAQLNTWAVVCSDSGDGGGDMYTPKAKIMGSNAIKLVNTNSSAQQITWFAIGK